MLVQCPAPLRKYRFYTFLGCARRERAAEREREYGRGARECCLPAGELNSIRLIFALAKESIIQDLIEWTQKCFLHDSRTRIMAFGDRLTKRSRNLLTTVGRVAVHDGKLAETVSRSPLSLANNAPTNQRPQLTLPFQGFSGRDGIQ